VFTQNAIIGTSTAATLALSASTSVAASIQDTYRDYADLAAHETEGEDYLRTVRHGTTTVAHIAIHGGTIEPPTTQLADHSAESGGHSFYSFEGIKPDGNWTLHITSARFDEPKALKLVGASHSTVSWHGAAGNAPTTYVGGLDTKLRNAVREELRAAGFNAPDTLPPGLEGKSPDNIVNKNHRGRGVQLEITQAQCEAFHDNGDPTDTFYRYTEAVERAVSRR
jgi:phage replication-related protein YjqB (UPF0714/DUF867 family)